MEQGTCSVVENGEPCGEAHYAHGWCNKHYQRWRKSGDPLATKGTRRGLAPAERFWAKVNKDGPIPEHRPDLGACWQWTGALVGGYGSFRGGGVAHVFAYQQLIGPVSAGLELDHLCRNRACVNPAHLEPVPHRENVLRGEGLAAANAHKTHCKHGHEFTLENTYMTKKGTRVCRECGKRTSHDYHHGTRKRRGIS